jgi:S1-C subfamily serine protease
LFVTGSAQAAKDCRIITSGRVRFSDRKMASRTATKEKESKPLSFMIFLDPSQAGITVEAGKGGLRVKEVKPGQRFRRAGLKAGDQLVSVDGQAVTSPEGFCRALRGKVAQGGPFPLKVRRGGRLLDLVVPREE